MLDALPTELIWSVFSYLDYDDLDQLLTIRCLETVVATYLFKHFHYQFKVADLLRWFEALPSDQRQLNDARDYVAHEVLDVLCRHVQLCAKFDQRNKFSELLDRLQHMVVTRILDPDLPDGLEYDYGLLCLTIRYIYLHTADIRVLHDPKYRRRSTKHPLAPFLPRDYTWIWRMYCNYAKDWATPTIPRWWWWQRQLNTMWQTPTRRRSCLRFTRFFGLLFEATSLYLESTLDGTFEECTREALVTGNAEALLLLCEAAQKPVDVESMCMSVSLAGEQLWFYLDTLDDRMTQQPTAEQLARIQLQQQQQEQQDQVDAPMTPPEWLLPERYQVHTNTKLRLKEEIDVCFYA
ncbi:hypothetical protein DM01DRAFT_361771 [Hesseltinella vesiculosa]|uniref:F-box domain-containing protein n=1 Tax=Hesseltinella vesiculosa TaxID=101127 RepID=A0A1X2G397_9FUNG|nr:hypothetical protein DM01DRAFT_361771 [Hesseltinella vesiculosa]